MNNTYILNNAPIRFLRADRFLLVFSVLNNSCKWAVTSFDLMPSPTSAISWVTEDIKSNSIDIVIKLYKKHGIIKEMDYDERAAQVACGLCFDGYKNDKIVKIYTILKPEMISDISSGSCPGSCPGNDIKKYE